jgi:hypothetical protein
MVRAGLCCAIAISLALAFATPILRAQAVGQSPGPALTITGQLSKAKIRTSESVPFWITFRNSGAAAVKDVRLVQFPNSEYSVCVINAQSGQCSGLSPGSQLIPEIAAAQSSTVWGELKPGSEHTAEKVSFVVSWAFSNGAPSFAAVPLGENTVQSPWDYHWDKWISGTVKTLAVPAALAWLAFLLNLVTKQRESRERERDRQEEKYETRRATEQSVATETWKQMLPLSHTYAGTLYLPISSAAEDAIDAFSDSDGHAAFFFILLLLKRIDLARKSIGGLYFKSYTGEELAQLCWRRFRSTFLGEGTEKFYLDMHQCSKLLEKIDDFDDFKIQYLDNTNSNTSQLTAAFTEFERRRADKAILDSSVDFLRAFFSILDYEANRPYEHWYGRKARLKATQEALELMRKLAAEKKIEGASEYFSDVKIIQPAGNGRGTTP